MFGGSGSIAYNGQNEFADVIGGNSDAIHAGAGGGWYQGGSAGHSLILGSNSGADTVLQGSGSGDTLMTGDAAGNAYLLAGAGNETLNGGNA